MTETNRNTEPAGTEAFLAILKKSGLVTFEKLNAVLQEFRQTAAENANDVSTVARHLIDAHLITRWQAEKLAKGRFKGFFLGKYRLLDHLGTGGMSTVFLAEHVLTGQKRAIKVLPRTKITERSYLARFYREGRAVAALNHPNIVRIYDIADEGDTHYMVMEFIEGSDLFDIVNEQGPIEFEVARDCLIQAARGLSHAHEKKLIHRDIKPANLFRTAGGTVKVLDLGLALLKSEDDDHGLSKQHNEQTMGTADYLAPEQALNSHDVDPRADIYSLGCTLFFLLTGRPPFNEGTLAQRIAMHQAKAPPEISTMRTDCPEYLVAICNQMMQKEADDRFQNCDDVIAALENRTVPQRKQYRVRESAGNPGLAVIPTGSRGTATTTKTAAARKRRRYPWGLVTLLALLAIVPIVLAIIAMSSPKSGTGNQGTQIPGELVNGDAAGVSAEGDRNVDRDSGESKNGQRGPAIDPNSTAMVVFEDFESPGSFPDGMDSWDLITAESVVGKLFSRGKCRVLARPDSSPADVGQYCLSIAGNSLEVEFRPQHPDAKIDQIRFLARRMTENSPFEFEIEAKSNQKFERWKRVYSAAAQINDREFNEIIIAPEHFADTDSRKFRFKLIGSKNDGVYIDNLKIELE